MSFETAAIAAVSKSELYGLLAQQAEALLHGERDRVANAANLAALIYHQVPDLNWAGFYFYDGRELVLGPFQGQVACVRIAQGRGVCGTAAQRRRTVIVPNVHEFAGHIACDSASNSELVTPLTRGDELLGVLDLDSPKFERFDSDDAAGLERLAAIWVRQAL